MDFSCSRLRELLHSGGSSAVIEYLAETIKRHRTDVIVTTLQAEIEKFMRLEQQDLEQCAFEIQELLTSNNISMGVEYEVFNERAKNGRSCHDRKASALETIGKHWGSDVIQQYGWDHHAVDTFSKIWPTSLAESRDGTTLYLFSTERFWIAEILDRGG